MVSFLPDYKAPEMELLITGSNSSTFMNHTELAKGSVKAEAMKNNKVVPSSTPKREDVALVDIYIPSTDVFRYVLARACF